MSKKLVSAALTATTLLWAVGVAALPVANAQSTASYQATIQQLQAEIAQLMAQMGSSSAAPATASYTFSKDLTLGSKGADVSALQQLLISKGYLTAVSAPTGYFGPATQKALAAWQSASGISPAAGYFGPKTRAFVNSMSVATPSTPSTPSTPGSPVTTPSVVAPATGLAVSVASDNPATGSIISGSSGSGSAARVPVLGVNFTAGNSGAVTISEVKFHKIGVLSDSSISGAYLVQNGQVVAQYNSINQGVVDFSGLQLSVPAGQTLDLQLAIDPSTGLAAGNTVGFSLNAASDVTAWDVSNNAVTPTGLFPVSGNTQTVTTVTNPALASLAIGSTSIATQVTAGTQNNIVGAWNFNVNNNLIWLKGIAFHVIGSANKSDLRNVKLVVNGTQVGQSLATVPANGIAYFNLLATPATLNTGSNNVQLFADVMGSPSYNFQFEVLNSYEVLAVDSQYNVPIAVTNRFPTTGSTYTTGVGSAVTIQTGTITTSQDSATPTGNVAVGQSSVTLAKFDIYAGGEAVKMQFIDFALAFTGAASTSQLNSAIRNIALTDDAGGQVGTTINTPPSGNACAQQSQNTAASGIATPTAGSETFGGTSVTYVDCFGTSASNINYVIPANTTRVLSLKGDIQSGAVFSTVTASLLSESGNLQGLTSSQTGSSSGAAGSALSLTSSLLTVAQNNALATPVSITPNSSHVKIGSYNFQASSASGVQVNTLTFLMGNSGPTSTFQNLGAWVNGTQFGTTQGVVTAAQSVSFSGTPFTVPAGQSVNVDLYADVLSTGISTTGAATKLTGCSGTGITSYNAISCSTAYPLGVSGQQVSITSGSTITVSADGSQPSAGQLVMGSTGNTLAIYRFTETANSENVKVTTLPVLDVVSPSSSNASFSNLSLWSGSTELGTVGSAGASSSCTTAICGTGNGSDAYYIYNFQIQGTPIVIPKANSVSITLKGDASPYGTGVTDAGTNQFMISSTTIGNGLTALGQSSNLSATTSLSSAVGNTQTVLRTILTPSVNNSVADGTYFIVPNHNSRNSQDDLAEIKFAANNSGGAILSELTVTFSGSLASTTAVETLGGDINATSSATYTSFLQGVQLLDSNGIDILTDNASTTVTASGTCAGGAACTVTWAIPTSTTQAQVSSGGTGLFKLRINDQDGQPALTNTALSLSTNIVAAGDVQYYDSLDSTAKHITSVPTNLVPIQVSSFALPLGN